MRGVPSSFDPKIVRRIDARLADVVHEHDVVIPLAVESGSRAWGFPSPDSDYDCRFVFVRAADAYLTPWPAADVVETPLDGELDVNGWDLAKAVRLLAKGNATILEWLRSPIVYTVDPEFRSSFLLLAERVVDRGQVARHYLHLGRRQWERWSGDDQSVALKKVFYALRPAAALRWLREHPHGGEPPMALPQLVDEIDVPRAVLAAADELIRIKASTREMAEDRCPGRSGTSSARSSRATTGRVRRPRGRPSSRSARRSSGPRCGGSGSAVRGLSVHRRPNRPGVLVEPLTEPVCGPTMSRLVTAEEWATHEPCTNASRPPCRRWARAGAALAGGACRGR